MGSFRPFSVRQANVWFGPLADKDKMGGIRLFAAVGTNVGFAHTRRTLKSVVSAPNRNACDNKREAAFQSNRILLASTLQKLATKSNKTKIAAVAKANTKDFWKLLETSDLSYRKIDDLRNKLFSKKGHI